MAKAVAVGSALGATGPGVTTSVWALESPGTFAVAAAAVVLMLDSEGVGAAWPDCVPPAPELAGFGLAPAAGLELFGERSGLAPSTGQGRCERRGLLHYRLDRRTGGRQRLNRRSWRRCRWR